MNEWDDATVAARLRGNPDLLKANVTHVKGNAPYDVTPFDCPMPLDHVTDIGTKVATRKSHPHDDYIAQIIELAHLRGWKVATFRPAQTSKGWRTPVGADAQGWPDLVLARPHTDEVSGIEVKGVPDLLFWEVKCGKDKVRPEQAAWLELLGGRVIRESDWQFIQGALR